MEKFLTFLFHDPILFVTALVLLATIVILGWALNAWRNAGLLLDDDAPDEDDEDGSHDEEPEASGLLEARLREVSSQLSEINTRLAAMEKKTSETKAVEQTVQTTAVPHGSPLPPHEIERLVKRLESKIEALANEKSVLPSDSITRLETRLEGIHRLLILLTDGEGSGTGK